MCVYNPLFFSYVVYQRLGCPRAYQTFYTAQCVVSEASLVDKIPADVFTLSIVDLEPYTSYQWKVEAENTVGITESESWSSHHVTDSIGVSVCTVQV